MAEARSRLEYLYPGAEPPSNWTKADTEQGSSGGTLGTGASAVVKLKILQKINFPSTAHIILFNKAKNPLSSTTAADSKGRLTGIFTNFMQCRIIEEETGLVTFRGRIYNIDERWDNAYGNVIDLVLKDALAELQGYPMDSAPDSLASVDIEAAAYNTRSEVIAHIISEIGMSGNILTSNNTLFEDSLAGFGGSGGLTFDLTDNKDSALKVIHDIASSEAQTADGSGKTTGWDYYVDTNTITNSLVAPSPGGPTPPNLNYFSRGSRPGPGGANLQDPSKYSLTLELPADNWTGDTSFKRAMGNDAEFERPNDEIYTSVNLRYQESNEDSVAAGVAGGSTKGVIRKVYFEILNGNVGASSTSGFAGSLPAAVGKSIDVSNTDSSTHPDKLYVLNNAVAVATVQYQSGTGASQFLLLSDITAVFNALTGNQTLYRVYNDNTSASITFNAVTDRPSKSFGIQKPSRMQLKTLPQYDKVRRQVLGNLVKASTEIVRGQFSTTKYPYFNIEADAANITVSTNQFTFADAGGLSTFANAAYTSGNTNRTNDVRQFGVKVGMVVAEVDTPNTQALKRYAYISSITTNGTVITYGSGATDTSDGVALNPSNDLRIFIPLHAGDLIFTKNRISEITSNQLIVELEHEEEIGVSLCTMKAVGNNTTGANRPLGEASGAPPSIIGKAIQEVIDILPEALGRGVLPWTFSTEIGATASNVISWGHVTVGASNVLTIGNVLSVTMPDSNSSTANGGSPLANGVWAMYYRLGTSFSFTAKASYVAQENDVLIAWVEIKSQSVGLPTIQFNGAGSIGSNNSYDASDVIIEDTIDSLRLKRGARGFKSDLRVFGGMVSQIATTALLNNATTVDVTTSSSAHALEFNVSAADGSNDAFIKIDDEVLKVGVTRSGALLEDCVRAQKGTSYAAHLVGANIFQTQAQTISAYKELPLEATKNASNPATAASVYFQVGAASGSAAQAFSLTAISKGRYIDNDKIIQSSSSGNTLFAPANKEITYQLYCDIPASDTAVSIRASTDERDVLGDDVLHLGMMIIASKEGSLVDKDGPTFIMDNSKEPMVSASVISANAILAQNIQANQIIGEHLQADMILGTNITATAQDDTVSDKRLKLTPSTFNAYTQQSTSDSNYKWFSLDRDTKTLYMGEGVSTSGTPAGMYASLRLHEDGINLIRRDDTSELSSYLAFEHATGGLNEARMWAYTGKTTAGTTYNYYYGSVEEGLLISTYLGDRNITFHSGGVDTSFHPSQVGTYNSSSSGYASETDSTGTTLKDPGAFNAGMVGRDIARINADSSITHGIVTGFTDANTITTSFGSWDVGRAYHLPRSGNYFTNYFGKFGQGVARTSDYKLPEISGTAYTHEAVHKVWSNMASYTFEGGTLRLWQKPAVDEWSTFTMERSTQNLGGHIEFGYSYNVNSKGDSYKINWPHPDAETSIAVGDVLSIETYETATTAQYYGGPLGLAMGELTADMTDSQEFMLVDSTAQASVGSSVTVLNNTNTNQLEAGVTVTAITSSVRIEIARSSNPQAVLAHDESVPRTRLAFISAPSIDGSKDRPYRMKLEWNTPDGDATTSLLRANSITSMVESFLYG